MKNITVLFQSQNVLRQGIIVFFGINGSKKRGE